MIFHSILLFALITVLVNIRVIIDLHDDHELVFNYIVVDAVVNLFLIIFPYCVRRGICYKCLMGWIMSMEAMFFLDATEVGPGCDVL